MASESSGCVRAYFRIGRAGAGARGSNGSRCRVRAAGVGRVPPEASEPFEDVVALPPRDLFKPLIADPCEPQFAIKYQCYESSVQTFDAGNVSFGD